MSIYSKMITKKEDLERSKSIYSKYLKGRKNPKNEFCFEAGFDFGYERGLFAAWCIFQGNSEDVIKKEESHGGFFRKYVASLSVHKLMGLLMDYRNSHECDSSLKYKPVDCFCEKCGK